MTTIHFQRSHATIGNRGENALFLSDMDVYGPDQIEKALDKLCQEHDVWIDAPLNKVVEILHQRFICVKAAGGVVRCPEGEELIIERNNRWDIPKGMVEKGETLREAAMREVSEETGLPLDGLKIRDLIEKTYHIYNLYGGWHLKQTSWFRIDADQKYTPTPQSEEGIVRCEWCSSAVRRERLSTSFSALQMLNQKI